MSRTPTDIFPDINIPVIAVGWQFTGLNPEELEGRLMTGFERVLTTTVDNIEHLESTTVNGQAMVKIFLQPHARLDRANAQVTAVSQTILRQLPPGTLLPLIINYSASSVPILQLGWTALAGVTLLLISGCPPRQLMAEVDGPLPLFFGALFVIVVGLDAVGILAKVSPRVLPLFHAPGLLGVVHFGWIRAGLKHRLQRAICAGGSELG
jgi:Na+/H+ antiporter NhaD/arsenite permease-like protein